MTYDCPWTSGCFAGADPESLDQLATAEIKKKPSVGASITASIILRSI